MTFILETKPIAPFFTEDEIDALSSFTPQDGLALSIYLDLGSLGSAETAMGALQRLVDDELRAAGASDAARQAFQEDIDLVRLFLTTKRGRRARWFAIFSCARELYWQTFCLPGPVSTQVYCASRFVTGPLFSAMEEPARLDIGPEESEKLIA